MRRQVVCGREGPYAGWTFCVLNPEHDGAHLDGKGHKWFECPGCGRITQPDDAPPGRKLVGILKCYCGYRPQRLPHRAARSDAHKSESGPGDPR